MVTDQRFSKAEIPNMDLALLLFALGRCGYLRVALAQLCNTAVMTTQKHDRYNQRAIGIDKRLSTFDRAGQAKRG